VPYEVLLAVASLEVQGAALSGEALGVCDEEFRLVLGEGEEVLALDPERGIDEAVEGGLIGAGKGPS
jgi:hypothetical protein